MGRGYSASRLKNARATLRLKRERSVSMHALKQSVRSASASTAAGTGSEEAEAEGVRKIRVLRPRRMPSTATAVTASRGTSAAAALRKKLQQRTASAADMDGAEEESEQKRKKGEEGRGASSASASGRTRSKSMLLRTRISAMEEALADQLDASEDDEETVRTPDVMAKYKAAGRAIDEVLDVLSGACVSGANTKMLCDQGDAEIQLRLKKLYSKAKGSDGKRIPKGICYPTNVSVNEVLCNHSPHLIEEAVVLKGGDVVKIHLGCHLDGYPVSAARTVVVSPSAEEAASGVSMGRLSREDSNAMEAARVALTGMIHMLRPGTLNADITDFVARVGGNFGVEAVEGVLSNRTKRWVLDGSDCIIGRRITTSDPHQDVADCTLGEQQVWTLDVAFTTANTYRMMLSDDPTNLFRRTAEDFAADARVPRAEQVLTEITDNHYCFPFHFKYLTEPLKAKLGIHVLKSKGVVDRLPSLRCKGAKSITARFSATVAITAKRITVLCGAPSQVPLSLPDTLAPLAITEDVAEVLAVPLDFATEAAKRREEGEPARKRARTDHTS